MKPLHADYDVVIIGAGMVGATLACALTHGATDPARILLVEASPVRSGKAEQPGFDARSTVLSAGSVDYLARLGLWQGMAPRAAAIHHIEVSDQGHFGGVHLHDSDAGVEALGHVVENAAIGQALNTALLARSDFELCSPLQVTAVTPQPGAMQLALQSGDETSAITAKLVVLAEGGRSGLLQQLGIHVNSESYGQSAVIANLALSRPHDGIAYERFTVKGPLALLPLLPHAGQHRVALVWTHPQDDIASVMALDDTAFLARLQQDCGQRAGTFTHVGIRAVFPLSLQVAEEQLRPRLALLGNVAHTLHPVAGQGFNLALRDAMALAANVRQSLAQQQDPGNFNRLQAWWSEVQQDQLRTITFSDVMTRMFSSSNAALALVRKAGMIGLELLPPLKQSLARQAMGYHGAAVRL
ncbi:MAG TPA: 2-octaprenyl-6-methoxyphenyl hydroxylase [Candidatus Acidoferrum sp.]|nr:2-octaprenyl-6-methoxyphenyl hydroxylase [Candidatus Acidoferrum sp.]